MLQVKPSQCEPPHSVAIHCVGNVLRRRLWVLPKRTPTVDVFTRTPIDFRSHFA
jgi:hypothetical protein